MHIIAGRDLETLIVAARGIPNSDHREKITRIVEWLGDASSKLAEVSSVDSEIERLLPTTVTDLQPTLNLLVGAIEQASSGSASRAFETSIALIDRVLPELFVAMTLEDISESEELILKSTKENGQALRDSAYATLVSIRVDESVRELLDPAQEAVARTLQYMEDAEQSAANAAQSAGTAGTVSLAAHFRILAREHRVQANQFRTAAIGLIIGLFVLAGAAVAAIILWPNLFGSWQVIAAKGAAVLTFSALATYLARQSGHHRSLADWARSIETQIRSMPGIIGTMQVDADRSHANQLFVSRVLASPPDKNSQQVDLVSTAQIMEALSSVMKKSS